MKISASVGVGATNKPKDVGAIQVLLNRYIDDGKLPGAKHLSIDGDWGPNSKTAFAMFELVFMGWAIGKVEPGSARLDKLNEMSYAGIDSLLKKFEEDKDFWTESYEASAIGSASWIPDEAKDWAKREPVSDVEVGYFTTSDPDYGGVIGWKSADPSRFTITNRWSIIQFYQLKPEAGLFFELRGASETEALILSKTFKAWNNAVYYYVCTKHYSPSDSFTKIRLDSTQELLKVFELISFLPSGPLKAIKFFKPSKTSSENVSAILKEAGEHGGKLKTFLSRWDAISRKYFKD